MLRNAFYVMLAAVLLSGTFADTSYEHHNVCFLHFGKSLAKCTRTVKNLLVTIDTVIPDATIEEVAAFNLCSEIYKMTECLRTTLNLCPTPRHIRRVRMLLTRFHGNTFNLCYGEEENKATQKDGKTAQMTTVAATTGIREQTVNGETTTEFTDDPQSHDASTTVSNAVFETTKIKNNEEVYSHSNQLKGNINYVILILFTAYFVKRLCMIV